MEADRVPMHEAISHVISSSWEIVDKTLADHVDDTTVAEMGATYPSCWILVVGCSSIENADAEHLTIRVAPRGQLPFTSLGLLEDAISKLMAGTDG